MGAPRVPLIASSLTASFVAFTKSRRSVGSLFELRVLLKAFLALFHCVDNCDESEAREETDESREDDANRASILDA